MEKWYDYEGYKVRLEITSYSSDPKVMALIAKDEDGLEFTFFSVNLGSYTGESTFIRPNCTFIDTNNNPGAEAFLKELGAEPYRRFGEPVIGYSGFAQYPLYEFPDELLREIDADGYQKHLAEYMKAMRKEQRKLNIQMFGFDPLAAGEAEDQ